MKWTRLHRVFDLQKRWTHTGYTELVNRSLLHLSGPDSARFLNGLVSNRIENQSTGGVYTGVFNAKGRVLADAFVYFTHRLALAQELPTDKGLCNALGKDGVLDALDKDGILVDVDTRVCDGLYRTLLSHRLRSQVDIHLLPRDLFNVWAVWNTNGCALSAPSDSGHVGCLDNRAPHFASRLVLGAGQTPGDLTATAVRHDLRSYDVRRYQYGIPEGSYEIQPGRALPLEFCMDLMNGIDFDKGCYLGQELTIRSHHHGIIRKRVIPVLLSHGHKPDSDLELDPHFPQLAPYLTDTHMDIIKLAGAPESARSKPGTLLAAIGNVGLASVRLDQFGAPGALFKLSDLDPPVYVNGFQPFWWPQNLT